MDNILTAPTSPVPSSSSLHDNGQNAARFDTWMDAIVVLARGKGIIITKAELQQRHAWAAKRHESMDERSAMAALQDAAAPSGLQLEFLQTTLDAIPAMFLPAAFEMADGTMVIVESVSAQSVSLYIPEMEGGSSRTVMREAFAQSSTGRVMFVESASTVSRDARLEAFLSTPTRNWFRDIILKDKRGYRDVVLASIFGNLLSFSTALFAMQIWDRVIPAASIPTLWVLAIGTGIGLLLEFLLRTARVVVLDRMGKQADLAISSRVFARALDIKNDSRPKSTGSFIAQIRDIEQLRELLASTSIAALVDLPFVLLFLALFAMLAGDLTLVLVVALVLIAVPGLLIQIPLARITRQGMQEGAVRQAILMESVERIEEIKAAQAEPRFQSLWERLTTTSARIGSAQRFWSALFTNWTQTLQQLAYTAVLVAGAYKVMANEMSMGALIACSILTSRALVLFVPFGQIFTRWQSGKVSMEALQNLMEKPVDHDPEAGLLRRTRLRGHYEIQSLSYAYDVLAKVDLSVQKLEIRPGERVALLGQIGAGKSTLLRLLAGMAQPLGGSLLLDGTSLASINQSDVRREVAYLGQSAQLFLGTIRENILIGAPHASDEDILRALRVSGGLALVQGAANGLDHMLQEGGAGLSGGQRQTLLLARTLLRKSNVLLLDEPSASLDEQSERMLVRNLGEWLEDRTLVLTTNRWGLLPIVNRIVVVDKGAVVMDGPRAQVQAILKGKSATADAAAQNSPAVSGKIVGSVTTQAVPAGVKPDGKGR